MHGPLRLSAGGLDERVWQLCRWLRQQGWHAGAVIGVALDDPLLQVLAWWALARCRLVSVPLAAGMPAAASQRLLQRTGASALLCEPGHLGLPGLADLPAAALRLADLEHHSGSADTTWTDSAASTPLLHYKTSSGTTAEPKIVAATHAGMVASIQREIDVIGYPVGERYMTPVPLTHDGPRRRMLACIAAGGVAVMPPANPTVQALFDTIDAEDVRHFSCVPHQAHAMAMHVAAGQQRLPGMRCFRLSAGPSEASLHRLIRERLCDAVMVSYGCTELGPMTAALPALLAAQPDTVGLPLPGVEVELVDSHGRPVVPGSVGEVRVRAAGMPEAYLDDAEASQRSFRDGWFYPGDLARTGAGGLLQLLGRADAMMVMNGINIYPAEIEAAMLQHPAVADVVAFPLKHALANDVPVCAVVARTGTSPTVADLLQHGQSLLGSHRPQRLVLLAQIPRTAQGKVQRAALQAAVEAGLAQQQASAPLPQLPLHLTVGLTLPQPLTGATLSRLDDWLQHWLAVEGATALPAAGGAEPDASAWLQRVLCVARWLMQAARAPVFDNPRVLSCRPHPERPGQWQAAVCLPMVVNVPQALYTEALLGAQRLCLWAAAHPADDQVLQQLFAEVEQFLKTQLRTLVPDPKSTLPVLRAAHRRGIPFLHLGRGLYQLGWGQHLQRMLGSISERDGAIGARVCVDKAFTASMLRAAGLPTPEHRAAGSEHAARQAAKALGWPVVLKPRDGERGEGVTVNIRDEATLADAFAAALARSPSQRVLVERHVPGVCHRFFMVRGHLLYAVKRMPMSVQGNGVDDVATLVSAELARQQRRPPWERSGLEKIDALAEATLAAVGLQPGSVPAAGRWVALRPFETTAWGGVDEEVTGSAHADNVRAASQAAALVGLEMAGVDIISSDITVPWHANGAVINEVNYSPLLGGAEISRSHLGRFLQAFVHGKGMIPVEVYVGGPAAWQAAVERQRQLRQIGCRAALSSDTRTIAPGGEPWPMATTGLLARTRALVQWRSLQALLLVVQTDELLHTGWPIEAVSRLTVVDTLLQSMHAPGTPAPAENIARMVPLLQRWPRLAPSAPVTPQRHPG